MTTAFCRRGLLALAFLVASIGPPQSADPQDHAEALIEKLAYPRTIFVVRHAEKAAEPASDPALSKEGAERAQRLATMLAHAGVTHLFATELQRTQATLQPLALTSGARIEIAPARDPGAVVSAIEATRRGSVSVVAGHSNTVGPILARLTGGEAKVTLAETDYDRLFVVTQWGPGAASSVVELRY